MAASPSSVKQVTLANAKQAAGGPPPVSCGPGCKRCRRVDLQLLVTLPSVAPKEHAKAIAEAGHAWAPALHPDFSKVARKATMPVARLARRGYIMVYFKERGCWDVWQVVDHGLTVKLMHQVTTQQYAKLQLGAVKKADATAVCSRKAANLNAQMICIEGASTVASVWIAFTDYLWTPAVLARYAANASVEVTGADGKPQRVALQSLRGRELSPKDVLGGKVPANGLTLTADNLQKHLVDYAKSAPASFKNAFPRAQKPIDMERIGRATAFAEQVRAIEKASGPAAQPDRYLEKSVLVMVPDPIGVADLHNDLRAAALADRYAWEGGGPDVTGKNADPSRPWKRQSLLHAAYIRDRVKNQVLNSELQRFGDGIRIDNYVISAEDHRKIKALEAQGKHFYPPGTTYEPFSNGSAFKVIFPEEYVAKRFTEHAGSKAEGRIARYNKHLNWSAIEAYNASWLRQERAWVDLLAARDVDYVAWMKSSEFKVAIQYDFDDVSALSRKQSDKEQRERNARDIAARLDATARCYGGGGLADASLKFLLDEFSKDENDRSHHVAAAMFAPFDIVDHAMKDAPTRADAFDAYESVRDGSTEFKLAWQQVSQPAAAAATILSQTAAQITQRMEAVTQLPAIAANKGLKAAAKDVVAKKVVWARAAGLHNYLQTGTRLYYVKVKWDAGAFAAAANQPTLQTVAMEVVSKIKKKRRAAAKSRSISGLDNAIRTVAANVEVTVPLVVDEGRLRKLAAKRGERMLDVVSFDIFGQSHGVTSLPESLAKAVVTEQSHFNWGKLKLGNTASNLLVLYLQGDATWVAFTDLSKKGGYDQIDAVASLISSVAGVSGALSELAVIAMTPAAANAAGLPLAAEFASAVPAYLRLKFAAGMLASAGAAFDAVSAYAKSQGRKAQGDKDASAAYFNAFAFQAVSSVSLGGGAFYAYRAAMLQRLGTQASLTALSSAFSPLMLARCLTGIGLLLWVAGLGFSIYGMYMEDDVNEIYLRRSIFGTGHKELGSYASLEHEMQAYMALSIGVTAELEWNDEMIGADELNAIVKVIKPDPTDVVSVLIEGFTGINKRKVSDIYRGNMPALVVDPDDGDGVIYLTQKTLKVPDGVKAVRMTYFLNKKTKEGSSAIARNELWIED